MSARRGRGLALAALACAAALAAGCARVPRAADARARPRAPAADSITVALWRMDENGGTRVLDAGPFRLEGTAGLETRTDFGRYRGARLFGRSIDSFVHVPHNPAMESARGLTVEAWVNVARFGPYELTPIAARWTQTANEQSWLFAVVGERRRPPFAPLPSPGHFESLVGLATRGQLVFAFQPLEAGAPRAFFTARAIEPGRWTHVAASYDGAVVRLYVDGDLEGQFATTGLIRPSSAPLLVGNAFEPRFLTTFGGDLRVGPAADPNPYYAFDGAIDELRLSSLARTGFPEVRR